MASFKWVSRPRKYDEEKSHGGGLSRVDSSHPLAACGWMTPQQQKESSPKFGQSSANKKKSSSASVAFNDPLSRALEGSDPLSQFASHKDDDDSSKEAHHQPGPSESIDEVSQEWLKHRTSILNKFTTTENLSITSSFLQGGEKLVVKQQINDKLKHRLQQLEFVDEHVREHKGLSRDDYVSRINQISHELHQAWALDQRVKALKIVIQCSKLLLETHPFAFYPSKFALVTDILDNFGRMVFERIAEKGDIKLVNHQLPKHFRPEYVSETAKETCRNWMYKIASIRELLPRIYVEMAVFKSYSFLENANFTEILIRMSKAIRGVGDPLVAAYARCYLCRVGREKFVKDQSFAVDNFNDLLLSYHQLYTADLRKELTIFRTDSASYLALYTPALDWMLGALVRSGQLRALDDIWRKCFQMNEPGLLWLSVLTQFPPEFVHPRSLELAALITTTPSTGIPVVQLMTLMGQLMSRLAAASPAALSGDDQPLKMIRTVWPYLARMEDVDLYLQCVDAWIPYLIRYWKPSETHLIIKEVLDHLRPKAQPHQVALLNSIVQSFVLSDHTDYHTLFSSDAVTGLLDVFPDGQSRADAAKILLQQFLLDYNRPLTHPSLVDHLLHLAGILHDTLNATSVEDEKRQIGELAVSLIDRVDFGRDFQQMLAFYGDARAAFTNLDPVLAFLVQMINRLSSRTRQMVKGEHTERTGQFVRACGAFAFITVPGIACPTTRFDLYLLSGQVALSNGCLGQADACLEAAINLVAEMPPGAEEASISSRLGNLLSTLLVQPDTPGQSRLHHLRRLLRQVRAFTTAHSLPRLRSSVYLQALRFLTASSQSSYLYHVPKVESNDELYLGDEEFRSELSDHCAQLLTELLNDIQQLGKEHHYRQQASTCLELFSVLIGTADLCAEPSLMTLAVQLYQLALKHKQHDPDHSARLADTIRFRADHHHEPFRQLASLLSL